MTANISTILDRFRSDAAFNGELTPVDIEYSFTTLKAALLVALGESGKSSTTDILPVVVVVASGAFNGAMEKLPNGFSPHTGTVLTEVIDTQTLQVAAWGIGDTRPDLTILGAVLKG